MAPLNPRQFLKTSCVNCGRELGHDPDDGWVDREASLNTDDCMWRGTCEASETFTAEHVPLFNN